ncbi:trk system potassium uptake protein TrkA [Micromonospora phaseoli]|uniref:Trk system potassium uptake protein TrkA n=1 Tax=Micromonospora phaseoli TaxID=1144548 RepID=A0A1H6XAE4_9ACTN|nr:TrkA family potassium uptake protein [Micromonospora phaseoli]PZW02170.1 trk system potassium uptake protein TrkA [Micromonospora phaseoli]GIJ75828.1 potassium transporter [Micromonospora phaseoli]SEJ26133.1 trk system potassium uptake protein TrkA [Micromonospora phaseoli]
MSDRNPDEGGIGVIGLGRFGCQLAESLAALGREVLAIDRDARKVQRWSTKLDQVAQADSTDEDALRQLDVGDLRRVVVAIGASVQASVLTVLALVELGVPQIWARATSAQHAKILSSVGAHRVIFPEAETGERLAHLIVSRMLDFAEFGDAFAVAKIHVPEALVGQATSEVRLLERYGIRVIGIRSPGEQQFRYVSDGLRLDKDSTLIVEGTIDDLQRFSTLS